MFLVPANVIPVYELHRGSSMEVSNYDQKTTDGAEHSPKETVAVYKASGYSSRDMNLSPAPDLC